MDSFDYIVVGAGSAGAALAARLSADPATRVLLLEAGGSDVGMRFDMVALATLRLRGNPATDWMYVGEPDPSRGGRREPQPRGRVLGGSSSINGTVYVRGNRGDYDHWAQLGNIGWDYDSMVRIFQRMEDGVGDLAESPLYGHGGPIRISESRGRHPLTRTFIDAMGELGVPTDRDYNDERQTSAGVARVNQYRGRRHGAGRGYLRPIALRQNLKVATGALVRRVLIEGRRAVGVEYELGGERLVARAAREVILSAGVFNSPKLLMLSGIGNPEHLAALGIPLVHANPHVGENLQDHVGVQVKALVRGRTVNMDNTRLGRLRLGLQYMLFGSGAATHHWPALAFVKLRPESEYPELQYHFGPFIADITPAGPVFPSHAGITLLSTVNRTRSRGHVRLRSADPMDAPEIQPNLLGDPHDLDMLVEAVAFSRRLLATRAFAAHVIQERSPGPAVKERSELEDFIRQTAGTAYHSAGTAKMGMDQAAVVDPRLRVIGVDGLRVADSSIIPTLPSGNTNAISIAIGEKASDLILEDARA